MIEQILPNLFKIEVPLPDIPLAILNAYLIKGPDRNLLVDTGIKREESKQAIEQAFKEADADLKKTDFFITHMHLDHFGLVSELRTESSKIFFSPVDAERIQGEDLWHDFIAFARLNGFPEEELQAVLVSHPGYRYHQARRKERFDFTFVREGDILRVGDYSFNIIETPGHTMGHLCLYEEKHKVLVAGDHLLHDITPTIQLWSGDENPLSEFLQSLDKVGGMDIHLVLPGHGRLIKNHRKRVDALKEHHEERAEEILSLLEEGGKTAYQVASGMRWDVDIEAWEVFPVVQKWFTVGETMAHLKYLEESGRVWKRVKDQTMTFLLP
jgi:glyoxylase-like metal-dependent hydrolase (beta-lactamase superfamily II)